MEGDFPISYERRSANESFSFSWDQYYDNALDRLSDYGGIEVCDPYELEDWFEDVGAPAKVMSFLTSNQFQLFASQQSVVPPPSVLDLACGNGSMLFHLKQQVHGRMVGLDYSRSSIALARQLQERYSDPVDLTESQPMYVVPFLEAGLDQIQFEVFDIFHDTVESASWWVEGGFDLVLDKGTFDAISLSSETITNDGNNASRLCEVYPRKAIDMVRPGGFLLITSCNWTEGELVRWFTTGPLIGELEVFARLKYARFQFGGQEGQGVATVCFKKLETPLAR